MFNRRLDQFTHGPQNTMPCFVEDLTVPRGTCRHEDYLYLEMSSIIIKLPQQFSTESRQMKRVVFMEPVKDVVFKGWHLQSRLP